MFKTIFVLGILLVACYTTTALLGGFEDASVDDEGVVTAANHATKEMSRQFNSKYHHTLYKVLKARRQIVAGTNYLLDVIVGETTCKKAEVEFEEAKECEYRDGVSTYKKCKVLVFIGLNDERKLRSFGCILTSKKDL